MIHDILRHYDVIIHDVIAIMSYAKYDLSVRTVINQGKTFMISGIKVLDGGSVLPGLACQQESDDH